MSEGEPHKPPVATAEVPPKEPPGQSIDPPAKIEHKPTEQELGKMRAYRVEPFSVEVEVGVPFGFKLIRYHTAPPWSFIDSDGNKHATSYDSAEEALTAAQEQASGA